MNFQQTIISTSHLFCVQWNTTSKFWLIHKCSVCTKFKHKHKNYEGMHINFDAVNLPRKPQVCTRNQENTNYTYRLLLWRANPSHFDALTHILLRIPRRSKYIKNTLNQFMHLVRLIWRSSSESKPVHSRLYSRLSQAWRTAEPIRIVSAVSNWFRRRTSPLNTIRLMWSAASEPGLRKTT